MLAGVVRGIEQGLGLGGVAVGVLVAHNLQARRAELAILRAMGFGRRRIAGLIFGEHAMLVAHGLLCGLVAGVVAVYPARSGRPLGIATQFGWLIVMLMIINVLTLAWVMLAARLATRGSPLGALRKE